MRQFDSVKGAVAQVLYLSLSTALLSACGGSDSDSSTSSPATSMTQSLSMTVSASPEAAHPAYHLAPAILDEPDETDVTELATSATLAPRHVEVREELSQLSSRRLTPQIMQQMIETGSVAQSALAQGSETDPMASTSGVTVYTPAQIRAAYGLPVIPSAASSVTSAQAAQLGAGQTIYIIDAYDDPNSAAELAAFDTKFGLPACKVSVILPSTSMPLAAAPVTGCTFTVVYANSNGVIVPTAPTYNSTWATEIALDVQWAHATAPYARIVLIESPDSTVTSFSAAAHLINSMGPGVVSMSFGSAEGSWTSSYDSNFAAAGMTYLAAAGDAGSEVEWPAVSSHVVAVAGTSLSYSGSGTRSESVWSGTGGGVSAYVLAPAYQDMTIPGLDAPKYRQVSDVAFNADPSTGQYLAVMPQGSTSPGWYSAGGTSLATPQWAGIIAIANAVRAQNAKGVVGAAQPLLYGFATQHAAYASDFLDVTKGSDGSCSVCSAEVGYDLPSGLGSPNVASLLPALTGSQTSAAPVVSSATVTGKVGSALSFAISATDSHALTYSLTSAPSGMTINPTTGIVSWHAPVLGAFSVVAQASDAQTGLSGQGTLSISIVGAQPPQVAGGTISGTSQTALAFAAQVNDANAVTYSLSGAPSGMTVSTAGVVSWPSPMAGAYSVTLSAHDATTGLSGQGVYTITIAAAKAPAVAARSVSLIAGKPVSVATNVPWSNPLTFSLSHAPSGMSIAASTGIIGWSSPVVGTYSVTLTAKDTKTGLSGTGIYTFVVTPSGPVVPATTLSGVAGKSLSASVAITDSAATGLSITISGLPAGMTVTAAGEVLTLKWASPVTGNYTLHLTVIDTKNLSAAATIPVTITAH